MKRYERQKLLGQGQMSEVWLARDTQSDTLVALKIMTAIPEDDKRNQKAQERFYREIQILRSLHHPHILPILNYGRMLYNNRLVPFLVLPYMPEGSLADLIQHRPPFTHWSLHQIADVIMQAADSLYYLHTCTPQIVHQDVKPGNFLIHSVQSRERAAELYLCDFGISRWLPSPSAMASELLGTFAFIAPEQVERRVHCASDQYALAVMACYLLTGKLPIQAATNEHYAQAHLNEEPIPPSRLNPERIPSSEIDAIILRALRKSPEHRFPTIIEFARTLAQALISGVQSRASAPTERLERPGPSMGFPRDLPQERVPEEVQTLPASPDVPIIIDPIDPYEERVLDEPLPLRPLKVVASQESRGFVPSPMKIVASLTLPARPKMLCWSPDGQSLAGVLYGHMPVVISRDGTIKAIQSAHAEQATSVCWSPDSSVLAVCLQDEIRFWNVNDQREYLLVLQHPVRAIDWSVHGQLAVWGDHEIMIYTLPVSALSGLPPQPSQTIATATLRPTNPALLRWSPDGSSLAAGAVNGVVQCWSMGQRSGEWQVVPLGQKVNSLAWSPDSSLLVVAFKDHRVVGWNSHTRAQLFSWEKLPMMSRMVSISQEYRIVLAGGEKRLLSGMPADSFPTASSPGQLLVTWSPTAKELATLGEQQEHVVVIWGE